MKFLKIAFFVIVSLVLILAVVGFLQPGTIKIQTERVIKAPVCKVFDHVNDMEKRLRWSTVENLDSNVITNLGDITTGEGASYTWANKVSGATGGVKYMEVSTNDYIIGNVAFGEIQEGHEELRFSEVRDGTRVTWFYRQKIGSNPFARIMGVFIKESFKEFFRPIYNESLKRLADDIEEYPEMPEHCIESLSFYREIRSLDE